VTPSVANVSCVRAKIKCIFLSFQYVEIATVVSLSVARAQATIATLVPDTAPRLPFVRASHSCHTEAEPTDMCRFTRFGGSARRRAIPQATKFLELPR
jgi:hypothetical protein